MKLSTNSHKLFINKILGKLFLSVIIFFLLNPVYSSCVCYKSGDILKTEVLVVGTIHQFHATDTNYTYFDILKILNTFNPDIVCVEIRPEDFRKEPYLREMTLATIWGITNDKKVYPIDWWLNDTRRVRDSLMQLPDFKQKEQQVEALREKDDIITNFEKKYGTFQEQTKMGYDFWNGIEYNEYTMENNRLWMEVFGDGPVTLYYKSRNDSMMSRINSAIHENPGKKVIVLTGSEHKHYFDKELSRNPEVSLIEFNAILPLTAIELNPVLSSFFDESNDLIYYEKGYPQDINNYYRAKLIPLIHGANMDMNPAIIPADNIVSAEKVINRWKDDPMSSASSDVITFELGWISFLKRDYNSAIGYLFPLSRSVEAGAITDPFLNAVTHRNLGFCYDCIGERDKAVACYSKGAELLGKTPFAQAKKMLFGNYDTQPFVREKR